MDSARRMARPPLDQLAGSLLGLAVGDAVGSVVEAQPPEVARGYVEDVLRPGRLPARGRDSFPFGQVTDDTQLARELLLSIGEDGALDPDLFADRLLNLVASGGLVGGGYASLSAARRLAVGVPWHEAGMPAPYAGNGAAMRAAPLGLLYGHDPRLLSRIVTDQARVTHQDARAAAGALAIAAAAAIAARREPVRAAEFLLEVSQQVAALDAATALTLRDLVNWVELPPDEAMRVFHARGLQPETPHGWQGISSHVTGSVCWSLYAFLQSPDSYLEAVCTAISVGGDSDSLAAMTGGIAGARLGIEAVPAQYRERLTDRGAWSALDLMVLAATVHGRVTRNFP